ncbi:MAG: zinc-dependent metalloprotease, partial [Myxococcota bacterium]
MRVFSRRLVAWAVCLAAVFAVAGCAEDVGDIDRTQPNKIVKSDLEGEWYSQRTVVDMPAADGFTFIGSMDNSGLTRVKWDIQENWLYARRQTELVEGADQKIEEGEAYKGEVIAAYRIQSHFDVQRKYNASTGEQSNIIYEDRSDRPWHEREYIRVDWSANRVTNYDLNFEAKSVEPVPYYVQEDDGDDIPNAHAPVFDYGERGEQDQDGPLNYFDITNKLFAKAGSIYFPGYGDIPLCWLRGYEFKECGAGEYTIRNSFMKIDPDKEYIPMDYSGNKSSIFGYFDTVRYNYDEQEGIREQGKKRYINRFNLWKKWYDRDGNVLPVEDRVLDPIVYHVNRDFPDDLKPMAIAVGEQWNKAFEGAVTAAGYDLQPNEDAFILCPNNPVEADDPAQCGAEGTSPRLGDIRYSFMAYVPKYMKYGLLGFGPANKDPQTGEIISGQAYVYHHNNTAAYRTLEMIELLNGNLSEDDFIDGVSLESWKERVNNGEGSANRTHDLTGNEPFLKNMTEKWDGPRFEVTEQDVEIQKEIGFESWIEPYMETIHRDSSLNPAHQASNRSLKNLKGSYIEDLLVNDEVLMATGHDPSTEITDHDMQRASVARGGFAREAMTRARLREKFAAENNMYLAGMADDALMGLARELKDEPSDEVYEKIRKAIYTAVIAHEVGHTLGLMHNFSGSEDVLNYFPEYWEKRDDGNVGPRMTDPITEDEINA